MENYTNPISASVASGLVSQREISTRPAATKNSRNQRIESRAIKDSLETTDSQAENQGALGNADSDGQQSGQFSDQTQCKGENLDLSG